MTESVGINLLWLVPGEVGGSEESTVASLLALAALAPSDLSLRIHASELFATAHPEVIDVLPSVLWPHSGRSRPARVLGESTWLARRTRELDLVHHAGGTLPFRHPTPSVLTIHDLQPLERRATHGVGKRLYLRATVPRSVRAARVVVTPSEFVRQSVLATFGVDPQRVLAVPHGVRRPEARTPRAELDARYQLDGPVVLYPAITYPHKNHRVLVAAFAQVQRRHPDALLVLTGGPGACEAEVLAQVEALGITARVRRTGRVPAADVAGLLDMATVVAVPSRYEGFGLPAAEAMVHGAPLVAADATAHPEVVGEAAVLVDPDDVGAWASALDELLTDPARRAALRAAGEARAARFSWEANATGLVRAYRQALGRA